MKVFATPAPDLIVRHPDTGKPLDAAGEPVDRNAYWLRRERDGDVTLTDTAAITVEEPVVPAKKTKS